MKEHTIPINRLTVDRVVLAVSGVVCLCIVQFTQLKSYTQNILILIAFMLLFSGLHRRLFSAGRTFEQLAKTALFCGYVIVLVENIRLLFLDTPVWQRLASVLILTCAFTGLASLCLLVFRSRNWMGRIIFIGLLILTGLIREPSSIFLVIAITLALLPYHCLREFNYKQLLLLGLLNFGLLAGLYLTVNPSMHFIEKMTEEWSLLPDAVYSACWILLQAIGWILIGAAIFYPLRPRSIRGRLRWAFLLNFFIPVSLLILLGLFSGLLLIGGYQIASAKRMLLQIGDQARGQAFQLWEAVQGSSREAPARSPFKRAGVAMFEDGSIQEFGEPPWELVDKLSSTESQDIEFMTVESPVWELWIAGFYRAPDHSGTAIAYRIDQTMLDYIQQVIGFDLVLTPGLNWGFLPFSKVDLPASSISTYDPAISSTEKRFPMGGILISRIEPTSEEDADILSVKPYATLRVVASRKLLSSSLLMAGHLTQVNFLLDSQAGDQIKLSRSDNGSLEDAQSVNVLGIVIFVLISVTAGVFVAIVMLSLFSSFIISRKINRSVRLIRDGTTHLRKGNLDHRIPIISEDELGHLSENFNMMAESLKKYQLEREIFLLQEAEQERMKKEFETARLLQHSLLPVVSPEHPHLEISGICLPAAEVGGDYFDYLHFYDNALGLAIGDVSGHGMSAGLLMSMAKSCLYNQVHVSAKIEDVIKSLNLMVHDAIRQRLLMTFLYGTFSTDGTSFQFASAGHHFPYCYRQKSKSLEELESVSYPLGVRREINVQSREIKLLPGDLLIFYTDGIVETLNPQGELFGFERLESAILEASERSVEQVRDHLLARISEFQSIADQIDDITLIIIKVKDAANESSGSAP